MIMRIPLIEDLTSEPIPEGSSILVEFDPASLWYNAAVTIAAGWLKDGGGVSFSAAGQSPDRVRTKLKRLGVDPARLESVTDVEGTGMLRIWDWYSASTGAKSQERFAIGSLKVADLSIYYSQQQLHGPPIPHRLLIIDDGSVLGRFNAENNWIEFDLSRIVPMARLRHARMITSMIRGVHSDAAVRRVEAAADGIVEFKLDESADPIQNLIRVKAMKDIGFDGRWHRLKVLDNQEVQVIK